MTTEHLVKIQLELEPVGTPWITITAGNQTVDQQLFNTSKFNFELIASDSSRISVVHRDKLDNDSSTAVIVKHLSFFGISDSRFIWQAQYRPEYPEPWHSQQVLLPPEIVTNTNYLGWNGVWSLEFGVPVFTWIHQVQNLGWIYN
jgi:hypothetical protein